MAVIYSFQPFNQQSFSLNRIYAGALQYGLDDDAYVTLNDITYSDLYWVRWADSLNQYFSVFPGSSLSVDSEGQLTGGTITGYVEHYLNGDDQTTIWMLQGIAVVATEVWNAARTTDTNDDFALLNRALAGNDSFYLSAWGDLASGRGGDDTLLGRGGDDILTGDLGNDHLLGGPGADILYGDAGHDLQRGHGGNDFLNLDAGNDRLEGGLGRDTLMINGSVGARINLGRTTAQATGFGQDTITGIEDVHGAEGRDQLTGNALANTLVGRGDDDRLGGAMGADLLDGGMGNDLLLGSGGDDRLTGGLGADTLEGGLGRDRLEAGVDTQVDIFVFRSAGASRPGETRDRLAQFDSGEDILDLRQIDANSVIAGNQRFSFSDRGPAAHAVWLADSGPNLLLRADVTGDQRVDFEISVLAVDDLVLRDILL